MPELSGLPKTKLRVPFPTKQGLQRKYFQVNTIVYFLFNQVLPSKRRRTNVPLEYAHVNRVRMGGQGPVATLPTKFSLVTWNIEMAYQRERVAKTLHSLTSDLLLLQEVPVFTKESAPLLADFAQYFAYAPGLFIKKPSDKYTFSHRGQLTLTSAQPLAAEVIPLPDVAGLNPDKNNHRHGSRVALYTRLRTPHGTLGVYNVHLENYSTPPGRRIQLGEVLRHMRARHDTYVIIAGDFNTIYGRFELIGLGKHQLVRAKSGRTASFMRLDHILHTRNVRVTAKVVKSDASDHKPIVAAIELL
jgi:endonuclease/exonuclease/phosphatase family metal-dependent hydrolase